MKKTKFAEIIGGIGVAIILTSYVLLNFNMISGTGLTYQFLNLVGSIGIIYNALIKKIKQPLILNILWALAAVVAIIRGVLFL